MMMDLAQPYIEPFVIVDSDLSRPWGGYYCIDPKMTADFIATYFKGLGANSSQATIFPEMHNLSPKILVIASGKRLSWQYHLRRKEIWTVVVGPVGVVRSLTDTEQPMTIHSTGEIITLDVEERHRLVGLDSPAIVAELWWHTDPKHPSNESDIIRVQDDFHR